MRAILAGLLLFAFCSAPPVEAKPAKNLSARGLRKNLIYKAKKHKKPAKAHWHNR